MHTDLFAALQDKENPRGHPILAALGYLFCPTAARWWLAGVDPVIPFDPLWQVLEDRVSGSSLKAALSSYGFADLLDVAQTYVNQVDAWRDRHPCTISQFTVSQPDPGLPAQPSRPPHPSSKRLPIRGYPLDSLHPCVGW